MRRFTALLSLLLLAAVAIDARAQAVPSATRRQLSITAGGTASVFQPDFADDWVDQAKTTTPCTSASLSCVPVASAGPYALFGVGAYVDVKLSRWVQFEGEARWQRFNQYVGIYQDNYLAGPRIPVYHFWKATVYGKALGGFSEMNFGTGNGHGRFTDVAFGGGVDVKLTKRLSIRALDAEYQYWPTWGNKTLSPYGASMGIGYKIF
jgi:hypothetical protein